MDERNVIYKPFLSHELNVLAERMLVGLSFLESIPDTNGEAKEVGGTMQWKYKAQDGKIFKLYPSYGGVLEIGQKIEIDSISQHERYMQGVATIVGFRLPVMTHRITQARDDTVDYIILIAGYNNGEPACQWIKPTMIKSNHIQNQNLSVPLAIPSTY